MNKSAYLREAERLHKETERMNSQTQKPCQSCKSLQDGSCRGGGSKMEAQKCFGAIFTPGAETAWTCSACLLFEKCIAAKKVLILADMVTQLKHIKANLS